MTDKENLANTLEQIRATIEDIIEKFATSSTIEGFSLLVKLVDLFEELINMDTGSTYVINNVDELNGILNSMVEAMGSGDVVLISDILEYRVKTYMNDVETRVGLLS